MADIGHSDLIRKVQSLSDLTVQATMNDMPSVLVSSHNDRRIDNLAASQNKAFVIRSEAPTPFIAIVNPNKKSGILWWKKATRLVSHGDRWSMTQNGRKTLSSEERLFIQGF